MLKYLFVSFIFIFSNLSMAQSHNHNVKHNMVLFGNQETFLSHIVFKNPHNYQVIMSVTLDQETLTTYLTEKKKHPSDKFIIYLDEMHIADIEKANRITGTLVRDSSEGRLTLKQGVTLEKSQYQILFFDVVEGL